MLFLVLGDIMKAHRVTHKHLQHTNSVWINIKEKAWLFVLEHKYFQANFGGKEILCNLNVAF